MNNALIKRTRLLDALALAGQSLGVSELGRRTEHAPSNMHRALQARSHLGLIAQDDVSCAHHCILHPFEWVCQVGDTCDARSATHEHLARLALDARKAIHLSLLDDARIAYFGKIDSLQPVRDHCQIGDRAPAHCVPVGKALPAPLPRLSTAKTVANCEALRVPPEQVHQRGYAMNRLERRVGVGGLGIPVLDKHEQAVTVTVVGLSAPIARLDAALTRSMPARHDQHWRPGAVRREDSKHRHHHAVNHGRASSFHRCPWGQARIRARATKMSTEVDCIAQAITTLIESVRSGRISAILSLH